MWGGGGEYLDLLCYLWIREIMDQEEQIIIGKEIHYLRAQLLESNFPNLRVGPSIS